MNLDILKYYQAGIKNEQHLIWVHTDENCQVYKEELSLQVSRRTRVYMHYVTFHSLKKVFIPTCSREIYLQTAFQRPASKSKLGRIFPLPVNLIHRYSGFCRILLSLKHMHQDYLNELLISQRLNHNTFSLVYSSNTNNSCSSHLFESTCYHYFKPTMKSF